MIKYRFTIKTYRVTAARSILIVLLLAASIKGNCQVLKYSEINDVMESKDYPRVAIQLVEANGFKYYVQLKKEGELSTNYLFKHRNKDIFASVAEPNDVTRLIEVTFSSDYKREFEKMSDDIKGSCKLLTDDADADRYSCDGGYIIDLKTLSHKNGTSYRVVINYTPL